METEMTAFSPKDFTKKYPDVCAECLDNGRVRLVPAAQNDQAMPAIGVEYWRVDTAGGKADPWNYQYSHTTPEREWTGPISHPSEEGVWIAARTYFIDLGVIEVPRDNAHLSDATRALVARAQDRRRAFEQPQVGDVVVDATGDRRRICLAMGYSFQTTPHIERDYHLNGDGSASYSGGMGRSVDAVELTASGTDRVRFWVFKEGVSGPGRGEDVFVDVAVWSWPGTFGGAW